MDEAALFALEARFDGSFPEEFVRDLRNEAVTVYTSTYDAIPQGTPDPYRHHKMSHNRHADMELVLLRVAERHGLNARVQTNLSKDGHTLIVQGEIAATVSHTRGPNAAPRAAVFRNNYSYAWFGQFPLSADDPQPVMVLDRSNPVYVLFSHGPESKLSRNLGFLRAGFLAPGAHAYFGGRTIDLMTRDVATSAEEQVARPEVSFRVPAAEVTGDAANGAQVGA